MGKMREKKARVFALARFSGATISQSRLEQANRGTATQYRFEEIQWFRFTVFTRTRRVQEQKGKGKQDDKQVVDTPLEEGLAGRRKSLGRTQASENQTASKHGANGSMWKGKVVFPSRLLIRTRRDFPFLLELNKLQRTGIFGGKK